MALPGCQHRSPIVTSPAFSKGASADALDRGRTAAANAAATAVTPTANRALFARLGRYSLLKGANPARCRRSQNV